MDFFTRFTREKTPQNNFSCQNFSIENNYLPTYSNLPFVFSGTMVDYSVRVSDLNRDEIMMKLGAKAREGYETEKMRKSLAFNLKKKHPLCYKVKMLSNSQLFRLCSSLSLNITRREKDKMAKLVVDHFFGKFPEAPLTNLKRVMDEDTYFAQFMEEDVTGGNARPTSIVSFFKLIYFFREIT